VQIADFRVTRTPNLLAGRLVCERRSAIVLDPGEREIDPSGNTGRRVDMAVLHPQPIVFDSHGRISRRQLLPELPVRRRAAVIQESCFGEQEGAHTHGAHAAHFSRDLLEPC
jgi:hypothetical protein